MVRRHGEVGDRLGEPGDAQRAVDHETVQNLGENKE